jgi:cation-transporting ATPase E
MIPEGLILLTSTVLAVAVIRLAKNDVLVQQLYCIETLARVDTLCLDKTGTITTGKMKVEAILPIASNSDESAANYDVNQVLHSLIETDHDPNETAAAIKEHFRGASYPHAWSATRVVEFSSDTKYSGATFNIAPTDPSETSDLANNNNETSFVMGAAQYVLAGYNELFESIQDQLDSLTKNSRVLLIAKVDGFNNEGLIIGKPTPLGFVTIHDEIRETAAQTIEFFKEQSVDLKVISGDDPKTVSNIANKVGIPNANNFVDASTLHTNQQISEAVNKYSVFGRVKPEQKKAFVDALQKEKHIVAMTGDGVNDVLSLKAADCSIAMASGSDAARSVAQLILVNNDFASMPKVVAEGRRSINNLQRSASLFLVKTILSIVLGIVFIFLPWQYPFEPIQMTLISAFTIGLPSFVLALEPNHDRVKGHFLQNCITFSVPGALCSIISILVTTIVGNEFLGLSYAQISTLCVYLMSYVGILLIIRLSIPFTPVRWALLVVVVGGLISVALLFSNIFDIAPLTQHMAFILVGGLIFNTVVFQFLYNESEKIHTRRLQKEK